MMGADSEECKYANNMAYYSQSIPANESVNDSDDDEEFSFSIEPESNELCLN